MAIGDRLLRGLLIDNQRSGISPLLLQVFLFIGFKLLEWMLTRNGDGSYGDMKADDQDLYDSLEDLLTRIQDIEL